MTAEQAKKLAERVERRRQRLYPRKLRQATKAALKTIRERIKDGNKEAVLDLKYLPHYPEIKLDDLKYQIERYGYKARKYPYGDILIVDW